LVLRDGDKCFYVDEDAIAPLWKGQRFPLEACVSGWSMLHRTHVVIEDIYADERIPHDAYRPTFVKSLVMVPIRTLDPLGAIGMYWADHHRATGREIAAARALADSTAIALEHTLVLADLARTVALSQTDTLTELPNRRAWEDTLAGALLGTDRHGAVVALIDIDNFKTYNDTYGHQAGDELLRDAATAWRGALRSGDLLARIGGDEFAVLMPGCDAAHAHQIAERLRQSTPCGGTASIGLAEWNGREDAVSVTRRADTALYEAKRAGRNRVAIAA
jgi:diguanylate cyclase (GGDEF)-like protein